MNNVARSDAPPRRMVRHVFWKYPLLSLVLLLVIGALAFVVGSPDSQRATISATAIPDPGGSILAFTQELDGSASSSGNAAQYGVGNPAQTFVVLPLRSALPLLVGPITVPGLPTLQGSEVKAALATFNAANAVQQQSWASAYDKALGTITPTAGGGAMAAVGSPTYTKIGGLHGDIGPVPTLVEADLFLAQTGYLERYLQSVDPGHSLHLVNIWLYDQPQMLNTAVHLKLTDDQWGMVKERGFTVGPWYLAVPAVFHIYFPKGATGTGFILWNLAFAALLLFAVPLTPGLRDLPKVLKIYRFMYRYPKPGELDQPAMRERHGTTHGGPES